MFHPSDLVSTSLKVPLIRTTLWQTVNKHVGYAWSLKGRSGRIGWDDSEERYNFSYKLGYYKVYADWTIPKGSEFRMIELAIMSTEWTAVLSTDEFKTSTFVMLNMLWQKPFAYEEING